jgi:hypothetical protein
VSRPVEVRRPQHLDDVGDRVLGQQHAAQRALLSGDVLRRGPVQVGAAAGVHRDQLAHAHGIDHPIECMFEIEPAASDIASGR